MHVLLARVGSKVLKLGMAASKHYTTHYPSDVSDEEREFFAPLLDGDGSRGAAALTMSEETIISTPAVETGVELIRECVATESVGMIVGNNGCGKTFALRAMEGRYPKLRLPGKCLRYRCRQATGVTRGVRRCPG